MNKLEEVIEYTVKQDRSYLTISDVGNIIKQGYLERTPRGRQVTQMAYDFLGKNSPSAQGTIF